MKWFAALLLAANLAVTAYIYWTQHEANQQASAYSPLNADKIVLLRSVTDNAPPQEKQAASGHGTICVEWRGMSESDLDRSRDAIKKLAERRVMSIEEIPLEKMYWVVFPPLPSESAAKIKLNELSGLKIKDAFIIKDSFMRNGLSMGLYGTEDAARRYMKELEAKGVSGLRIETKPKQGTDYYYIVKTEDAVTLRELDEIRVNFPASTLIRVECKK